MTGSNRAERAHAFGRIGGGEQAERAAHGVAGQHHGPKIERLQKDDQVAAQVEPGPPSLGLRWSAGAAVTAQVEREDAEIAGRGPRIVR